MKLLIVLGETVLNSRNRHPYALAVSENAVLARTHNMRAKRGKATN